MDKLVELTYQRLLDTQEWGLDVTEVPQNEDQKNERKNKVNKFLSKLWEEDLDIDQKAVIVISRWSPLEQKWIGDDLLFGFPNIIGEEKRLRKDSDDIIEQLKETTINIWLEDQSENEGENISPIYRINYNKECLEHLMLNGLNGENLDFGNIEKDQVKVRNSNFKFSKYLKITGDFIKEKLFANNHEQENLFGLIFPCVRSNKDKKQLYGVTFIYTNHDLENNKLVYLARGLDILFAKIIHEYSENALERARTYALKSAVAAIMARNMSHIHGSHIEPGLQHRMESFEKVLLDRLKEGRDVDE